MICGIGFAACKQAVFCQTMGLSSLRGFAVPAVFCYRIVFVGIFGGFSLF